MEVWCSGFMAGTELRSPAWNKLLDVDKPFSPLYLPWLLGSPEGRQKQWDDAVQWYRDEGYDAVEAKQMTLRWYGLPGTHRRMVSDLKKSILNLREHCGK